MPDTLQTTPAARSVSAQLQTAARASTVPAETAPPAPAWVADILDALCCPITRAPLRLATCAEMDVLNRAVAAGALHRRDGARVNAPVEAALLADDGRYAYGIVDEIALLTPDSAILADGSPPPDDGRLRAEKRDAQAFYDQIGWQRRSEDAFADSAMHEDLRPHVREYLLRCNRRVKELIAPTGRLLVDVASGPVQFDEYREYSAGYQYHVCVDLSYVALRAARRKLGPRGAYILGDITALPFRDGAIDAVVSMHTLYHVPRDEQPRAFREVHRVTRPGATSVVVYSTGHACKLMKLPLLRWRWTMRVGARLQWYARRLRQMLGGSTAITPPGPALYFHAHDLKWWLAQPWGFDVELRCWRAMHFFFTRRYVHRWLGGRALLRLVARLEERYPATMGRLGQYPMFVLRRPEEDGNR